MGRIMSVQQIKWVLLIIGLSSSPLMAANPIEMEEDTLGPAGNAEGERRLPWGAADLSSTEESTESSLREGTYITGEATIAPYFPLLPREELSPNYIGFMRALVEREGFIPSDDQLHDLLQWHLAGGGTPRPFLMLRRPSF